MIRICAVYEKQILKKIILEGHALYDEYGKDIVCAAVSATYLCTINAIYSLCEDSVCVNDSKVRKEIRVLKQEAVVISLLENMLRCLDSLERQYPNNIQLDKEES